MATVSLQGVLRQVRQLAGVQPASELTDGHLLDCFLIEHDQAAFESLVVRHGPMVQRVCQRVLGDVHAAEDAFQAVFLVLARKAQSIRRRSSIGGWLYEVAYHVAVRARTQASRRQQREWEAGSMQPTAAIVNLDRRETAALVEEQLARLPEKYRTPLVLCYLEGKTQVEAAEQLGCPTSSFASRLVRGRELLRARLLGRGLTLSAAGLTLHLSESAAAAALPAEVVLHTVRAALSATPTAGASAASLALAEGVLQTMAAARRTLVVLMVLCLGAFGVSAGVLGSYLLAPSPDVPDALVWTAAPAVPAEFREDPDLLALAIDAQGRVTAPGLAEPLTDSARIEGFLKQRFQDMEKTARARPGATDTIELTVAVRAQADTEYRAVLQLLKQAQTVGFSKLQLSALSRPVDLAVAPLSTGVLVKSVRNGLNDGAIAAMIVRQGEEGEWAAANLAALEKFLKEPGEDRVQQARRNELPVWADPSLKFGCFLDVVRVCLQAGFQRLQLGMPDEHAQPETARPAPMVLNPAPEERPHGTDEAGKQAAVSAGFHWLAQHQADDGRWSLHAFHRDGKCNCTGAGAHHDVAGAALALLALVRGGEHHQGKGQHARTVERGLKYLLDKQGPSGAFSSTLYEHGLASLALCEAYSRSQDANLRQPAQKAIDFIVDAQHEAGGWRYVPRTPGDLSVTGWQLQALRAGYLAGLKVPDETLRKANLFLDSVGTPDGSGYGYTGPNPAPTMTACGLLCRFWLAGDGGPLPGWSAGLLNLQKLGPEAKYRNLYFHYYATSAVNLDPATAAVWNPAMRKRLIEEQEWGSNPELAHQKGSWSPAGDAWSGQLGRVGQTALALLILQAPEQVVPLPNPPREPLAAKELDTLWSDLGSGNGFRANDAIRQLASVPAQSLPVLQDRLRPVAEIDGKLAQRWLIELDSDTFALRQQAEEELEKLGEGIIPTLRKALADKPSLEKGQRIERVLQRFEKVPLTPAQMQAVRALRVLESLGTPDARKHLDALAQGAPGVFLTREARNSLERLAKRP